MTLQEINDTCGAYLEVRKREAEEDRYRVYNQSVMIAEFVGCILGSEPIPTFNEVFPTAHKETVVPTTSGFIAADSDEANTIRIKEQLIEFAKHANAQRKKAGEK